MPTESPKQLKSIVKDLADGSSLHGIPKIVSSRQIAVKILWLLLFLATFSVFLLQLQSLFKEYYSFPIKTKVSLEFSPLKFPAVTFCNMNPIKKTRLETQEDLSLIFKSKKKVNKASSETGGTSSTDGTSSTGGARKRRRRGAPSPSSSVSVSPSTAMPPGTVYSSGAVSSTVAASSPVAPQPPAATASSFIAPSPSAVASSSAAPPPATASSIVASPPVAASSSIAPSSPMSSAAAPLPSSYAGAPSSALASSQNQVSPSYNPSYPSTAYPSMANPSSSYGYGGSAMYSSSSAYYDYYYDYWGTYDTTGWSHWSDPYYSNYSFDYSAYGYPTSWSAWAGTNEESISGYIWDQFNSPKDQWDERILAFQTAFKNHTYQNRVEMGHSVNDLVHSVAFARNLQNSSHFEQMTTSMYGNCYTMTSPKYIAWRSGPTHGIKLTLNLEIEEYIQNFATGYGVRLVFHEPGTFPLPEDEGMTLSPGYETSIGLRQVKVSRLGGKYGNCSEGHEFFKKYKIRYSVAACLQFCRSIKTLEMCQCMPPDAPDTVEANTTQTRICKNTNVQDKKCQLAVDVLFDEGQSLCNCISPCEEIVYQRTMSGRRWPKDDYLENVLLKDSCRRNMTALKTVCASILNNSLSSDDLTKYRYNFLRVLIYYEDLNFESIVQEPLYESTRFLSDIGGAMGLFMGASILSFVELLQLLLEIILFFYHRQFPSTAVEKLDQEAKMDDLFPHPEKKLSTVMTETDYSTNYDPPNFIK